MRLFSMAGASVWLTAGSTVSAEPASPGIDRLASELVREGYTPGIALAVMRNGRFVHARGYGAANLETKTPMTSQSVLRIGSVTKQFTAAAILLLREQGLIRLDDSLSRFVPDFPRAGEMTLRQLLTHSSGLGSFTDVNFLQSSRLDYDRAALMRKLAATTPLFLFHPGDAWAYSDTGFMLLGMVVEAASRQSYAEFLRRAVLGRAGLRATAVDDSSIIVPGRASGYSPHGAARGAYENASFISMTYAGGAGAIRSTPLDLCAWHQALLGGRVVSPDSLRQMLTPVRLASGAMPVKPAWTKHGQAGQPVAYGFGINLEPLDDNPAIFHEGMIQGFRTWLCTLPERNLTLCYIVNCDAGDDQFYARMRRFKSELVDSV